MEQIKDVIMQKLWEAEKAHNVKILFAIESGSRGWGFAATDADYDCRFVYAKPRDWYLSVFEKKDFVDCASDAIYDINGWDLKKFLLHITKSNAVTFEWLSSNEIYMKNEDAVEPLQALAESFFNPVAVSYHYLSTARNKLAEILSTDHAKIKRYFYALRPLANLQFIWQYGKMPPMEFTRTLSEIDSPGEIVADIRELMAIKCQSNENDLTPRNERLVSYIQGEIELFTERLKGMQFDKCKDYESIDATFRDIVEKVWRNG